MPLPIKLEWLTLIPIWVEQWLLLLFKLTSLESLFAEQLNVGHIELSDSSWNISVFVIQKKQQGKFGMLQGLRAINTTM